MDEIVREFNKAAEWRFGHRSDERWFRAIAEEAGEIVGAYNKWTDKNVSKPKIREDVFEEMTQTIGCIFAAGARIGYSVDDLIEGTRDFMISKSKLLRDEA